jgi:hypothetical protein
MEAPRAPSGHGFLNVRSEVRGTARHRKICGNGARAEMLLAFFAGICRKLLRLKRFEDRPPNAFFKLGVLGAGVPLPRPRPPQPPTKPLGKGQADSRECEALARVITSQSKMSFASTCFPYPFNGFPPQSLLQSGYSKQFPIKVQIHGNR